MCRSGPAAQAVQGQAVQLLHLCNGGVAVGQRSQRAERVAEPVRQEVFPGVAQPMGEPLPFGRRQVARRCRVQLGDVQAHSRSPLPHGSCIRGLNTLGIIRRRWAAALALGRTRRIRVAAVSTRDRPEHRRAPPCDTAPVSPPSGPISHLVDRLADRPAAGRRSASLWLPSPFVIVPIAAPAPLLLPPVAVTLPFAVLGATATALGTAPSGAAAGAPLRAFAGRPAVLRHSSRLGHERDEPPPPE